VPAAVFAAPSAGVVGRVVAVMPVAAVAFVVPFAGAADLAGLVSLFAGAAVRVAAFAAHGPVAFAGVAVHVSAAVVGFAADRCLAAFAGAADGPAHVLAAAVTFAAHAVVVVAVMLVD
jgi:hypothetical protein